MPMDIQEPLPDPPRQDVAEPPRVTAPKVWPVMALATVTLVLSVVTAWQGWVTRGNTDTVAERVVLNTRLLCETQLVRLNHDPVTPTERAMRQLAERNYGDACPDPGK